MQTLSPCSCGFGKRGSKEFSGTEFVSTSCFGQAKRAARKLRALRAKKRRRVRKRARERLVRLVRETRTWWPGMSRRHAPQARVCGLRRLKQVRYRPRVKPSKALKPQTARALVLTGDRFAPWVSHDESSGV